MRRWLLTVSLLLCRIALADEPVVEPPFKLLAATKPVSLEAVDKVVEESDRAVQSCNRNGRRLYTLAVLMNLTIDGDGNVTSVEAVPMEDAAAAGTSTKETACLARVAKKLKFPATGNASQVQYPFMLMPHRRSAF